MLGHRLEKSTVVEAFYSAGMAKPSLATAK